MGSGSGRSLYQWFVWRVWADRQQPDRVKTGSSSIQRTGLFLSIPTAFHLLAQTVQWGYWYRDGLA